MNALESRLRQFACSLLQRRGALIEWPAAADQGLVILPSALAAALGRNESAELTTRPPSAETPDAVSISLASDFLDKADGWLLGEPRVALVRLDEGYLKKSGVEEMVARQFQWANARVRVLDASHGRCDYHQWYFHAQLTSEERWEDILVVTLNARTGATATIGDVLSSSKWHPSGGDVSFSPDSLHHATRRAAAAAQPRAAGFITRLEQRLDRDRKRVEQYYHALLRQAKTHRHPVAEEDAKQEDRRRAVQLEMKRKLLELEDRYAILASITPVALLIADLPAMMVRCEVTRKRATATHQLYWNAVAKSLEPMVCSRCGCDCITVYFTDDTVAPLCATCFGS